MERIIECDNISKPFSLARAQVNVLCGKLNFSIYNRALLMFAKSYALFYISLQIKTLDFFTTS